MLKVAALWPVEVKKDHFGEVGDIPPHSEIDH